MIQVLLDKGEDPNDQDHTGSTVMMDAMETRDDQHTVEIMRLLLAKNADPNKKDKDGDTALMRGAKNVMIAEHFAEIFCLLLDHGVDINAQNNNGWTALMFLLKYIENTSQKKI